MTKADNKSLTKFVREENEFIKDLLLSCDVPDSIDDDYEQYLLDSKKPQSNAKHVAVPLDELQDRLERIKNKMKTKKRPTSERAQKKREAKKLKKNKEFKKVLVSAAKSIKNEHQKQIKTEDDKSKLDIKPILPKPIYNEEAKIVFSKIDFAPHPGAKKKKSHQNPREILKKIKQTDRQLNALKESGETEKAAEMKNDLAWKKAFDKVEGKKVKDDPKLLYKTIKKRKIEKKKSKKQWIDRKESVKKGIEKRQKQRQENLDKRSKDKKMRKMKKLTKKGKVIPGF